jgi:apolipoprotein N-acyltransferase
LVGFAPVLGVYGVSWLLLLWLGAGGLLLQGRRWPWSLVLGLPLAGWALSGIHWWSPLGEPFRVSLVQANIQQQYKWDPSLFTQSMERHLQLTRQSWDSDLIIWPETAVTAMVHEVKSVLLDPLEAQARKEGAEVLVGVPWMDLASGRYYNTLRNLGGEGGHYAKRHLVPFGEYAPMAWLLKPFVASLGVDLSDFTPGGEKPLLKVRGLSAGISICYEDAFGAEVRQALPQAAYLINVTNDGWFGDTLAPYQHLEIARMRALETGRYLLRATNTGVSAIIEPDGALQVYSSLMVEVAVHGQVQPLQGSTPYVWWGDLPVMLLVGLGFLLGMRFGFWEDVDEKR